MLLPQSQHHVGSQNNLGNWQVHFIHNDMSKKENLTKSERPPYRVAALQRSKVLLFALSY